LTVEHSCAGIPIVGTLILDLFRYFLNHRAVVVVGITSTTNRLMIEDTILFIGKDDRKFSTTAQSCYDCRVNNSLRFLENQTMTDFG
jgi:hypothetical protein